MDKKEQRRLAQEAERSRHIPENLDVLPMDADITDEEIAVEEEERRQLRAAARADAEHCVPTLRNDFNNR